MAATLEVPYAQRQSNFDADLARNVWRRPLPRPGAYPFPADLAGCREAREDFATLTQLRSDFQKIYRPTPDEALKLLGQFLAPDSLPTLRAECAAAHGPSACCPEAAGRGPGCLRRRPG